MKNIKVLILYVIISLFISKNLLANELKNELTMTYNEVKYSVRLMYKTTKDIKSPSALKYPNLIEKYGLPKTEKLIHKKIYQITHLSDNQQKFLLLTFTKGVSNDLQYTLSGILWEESQFGEYKINLSDPSCGYFHKMLPDFVKEAGGRVNNFTMSRACETLQDFEISFNTAVNDLNTKKRMAIFNKNFKNKAMIWRQMVMYYNGSGFDSKVYLDKIRLNIYLLKQIIDFKKINEKQKIVINNPEKDDDKNNSIKSCFIGKIFQF